MAGTLKSYDIAVVGAGMVGATVAVLLAKCGFSVGMVEARRPRVFDPGSSPGLRVSAISQGSAAILEQTGAWRLIESARHCPYLRMHVEDGDSSAGLDFEAPVFGMERLGTIVENDLVCWALWQELESTAAIGLHCPSRVQSFAQDSRKVTLALDNGSVIEAGLLVAADGAASVVRKLASIGQDSWDYNQKGLVCVARKELPNPGVAWQRFLPAGPLAFLPLSDGSSSIVWTLPADEAERKLGLEDAEFLAGLESASEGWLGRVTACGPRAAFPLSMSISKQYVVNRLVLLGDSAHVVHPLAGQGVNLGLADAAALVEVLMRHRQAGTGTPGPAGLGEFERWRKSESEMMAAGIHALRALFMPPGLAGVRRLGLKMVSRSWNAKEAFLLRAAGQGRNAPLLACGHSLQNLGPGPKSKMNV